MLEGLQRFDFSLFQSFKVEALVPSQLRYHQRSLERQIRDKLSRYGKETQERHELSHIGRVLKSTDHISRPPHYNKSASLNYMAKVVDTVLEKEEAFLELQ